MDADIARAQLLMQHERIRVHLGECSTLAQCLLDGDPVQVQLDAALVRLREEFADHNMTESQMVGPLLHGSPDWGGLLVDRMLEEHAAEHAAFWELLTGSALEVAARMDELVEELDAHMAAEERTFLSPLVLRSDVISGHRRV